MSYEIVPMLPEHADRAAVLEARCFSTPWSVAMMKDELENPRTVYFAAVQNGKVLGYAGMHTVLDEGYITNIAVAPEYRGLGIGTALLDTLYAVAAGKNLRFLTLEVRESNAAAIELYRAAGFSEAGRRRAYYRSPAEDAVLMTLWLDREE